MQARNSLHFYSTKIYSAGMSVSEISSEYGIAKSTINVKDVKEIKAAIMRIYKANKDIYGAPRIHYILATEGFAVIEKSSKKND